VSLAAELVDRAAEATVVPSFSRLGCLARARLEHWGPAPALAGRCAVVTGATSGIGLAVAAGLGGLGACVHLVGRDSARGERARALVLATGAANAELHLADVSEPAEVGRLSDELLLAGPLAAVVHCAGALLPGYTTNSVGTEATVATHVFGPYQLTARLASALAPGATVVAVSSGGMYLQPFDAAQLESAPGAYRGSTAYARSKRAQVLLARAWADRLAPSGGSAYSVHPGWARTPGLRSGLPAFYHLAGPLLRSPQEGAGTAVWLAAGGALGQATGRFFHDRRPRPDARWPVRHPYRSGRQGRPESEQLFQWCAVRTGVRWPGTPGPLSAAAAGAPSPGAGTGAGGSG
jgi:NAD(P)-dependent dehydrogenase (short-subunit alcohol dehydrogenase family)